MNQNDQNLKNDLNNVISENDQIKLLKLNYYLNIDIRETINATNYGFIYVHNLFSYFNKMVNQIDYDRKSTTAAVSVKTELFLDVLLALKLPNHYYYMILDSSLLSLQYIRPRNSTKTEDVTIKFLYQLEDVTCYSYWCHDLCKLSKTNQCNFLKLFEKVKKHLDFLNNNDNNPNQICKKI